MSRSAPDTTSALAKHLGLSRWTVSRVLNGHTDVKEETVRKVRQAINELGFQPNAMARGLRGGQTKAIGVCFQDLENPILAARAGSLQQLLRERGYHAVIELSNASAELERGAINRFLSLRVDGVVLIFSQLQPDDAVVTSMQRQGIPCVWVDPLHDVPGDKLTLDRSESIRLTLEHLHRETSTPIAILGIDPDERYGSLRWQGIRKFADKHELTIGKDLPMLFESGQSLQGYDYGRRLAEEFLDRYPASDRPQAIACINDRVAIGVINRLRQSGITVPDDILITGHDNLSFAENYHPALTTIDQQTNRMMQLAVDRLMARLSGESDGDESITTEIEPKLIIRASSRLEPSQ